MKDKNIHFIVNPISGNGKGYEVINRIKELFAGWNIQIKITQKKNDGYRFTLLSIEESADLIVSCGGDGTLNEVASALVKKNIPMAIVPIGSGNGLARHLQLPLQYENALQTIKTSKYIVEHIDCGKINNTYFFSNAGIGFDAEAVKVYAHQKQRQLIGYFKSVFLSIFKFKPVQIVLESEQKKYSGKIMLLNISNSNCLGYGFSIAPRASLQDGEFDVNLVKKCSWLSFAWVGIGFLLDRNMEKKRKVFFKTKEIDLDINVDYMQLDGEYTPLDTNHLKIGIIPQALLLLVG